MAYLQVPIDGSSPDHEFSMSLDGVIFLLRFMLNSRTDRWTMILKSEDGTILAAGMPIVLSTPLLASHKKEGMPAGDFICIDETEENNEPLGIEVFGVTHSLIYREAST